MIPVLKKKALCIIWLNFLADTSISCFVAIWRRISRNLCVECCVENINATAIGHISINRSHPFRYNLKQFQSGAEFYQCSAWKTVKFSSTVTFVWIYRIITAPSESAFTLLPTSFFEWWTNDRLSVLKKRCVCGRRVVSLVHSFRSSAHTQSTWLYTHIRQTTISKSRVYYSDFVWRQPKRQCDIESGFTWDEEVKITCNTSIWNHKL